MTDGSFHIENALKDPEESEFDGSTDRGSLNSDTPKVVSYPLDTFQLLTQDTSEPDQDAYYIRRIVGQSIHSNLI